MMKLYFSPSTSSLATHIALIEAGAPFELVPIILPKSENKAPGYLTVNPEGKVPTLITDGGKVLTEVAATLYYIAKKYPKAGLWPEGDLEAEAQAISWMSFAASRIHMARSEPEVLASVFRLAEDRLAGREWAVGRYSVADIHLFRLYWRFRPSIDAPKGTYPALEAHEARMLARPAVKKAMEAEKAYG